MKYEIIKTNNFEVKGTVGMLGFIDTTEIFNIVDRNGLPYQRKDLDMVDLCNTVGAELGDKIKITIEKV